MTDPLGPLRALNERFAKEAADRGLDTRMFAAEPKAGADIVHVILTSDPDTLAAPLDQPAIDAAFAETMAADAAADRARRLDEAADELSRRLARGGSILGEE